MTPSLKETPMSEARIGYSAENGVARIVLDQIAKHNAMSFSMWSDLPGAVDKALADPSVRVITVEGAGEKAFCSGADISQFGEQRAGPQAVAAYNNAVNGGYGALSNATKPTVAIIRGICFGGGMALAMCCDLRIAATGSRYRIPAGRLGLGYGYDAVMQLVRRLGAGAVAEILFTAKILSAEEARSLGVLQQLYPADSFDAEAAAYVGLIAENAPLTLAAVKRTLLDVDRLEADRDPAAVAAIVAACYASADYQEGQAAFKEKRTPRFTGR
jgi:enoyl-CoA hydratase/carnithine racemase